MAILRDMTKGPKGKGEIKQVHTCAYCTKGVIHIIDPTSYPNDIIAKKDKLGYKCGNCQEIETQDRIVRATPNGTRTREIIAEEQAGINRYNNYAQRLNNAAGQTLMKLKTNRYSK